MKLYKSERTIKRLLKHYRHLVEHSPDKAVRRIAQGMEEAIRYVTKDTRGWNMEKSPEELAHFLKLD